MTQFKDWWQQLEADGVPLPYLLIDCAGIDGGEAALPREAFSELECLFTGNLAEELADVSGYLGRVKAWGDGNAIEDLLERQVGLVLSLPEPAHGAEAPTFAQVHRHLRKFNVVYGPDDKPLFFRYYDPRVIVNVLSVLDAQQLDAFFGPIDSLIIHSVEGTLMRCSRHEGALTVDIL